MKIPFRGRGVHPGSREHYEDAELYDFEYRRRRADVAFYRSLAKEVGNGISILELGIGTGRVATALARDGHQVVGLDLSEPMLLHAARRAAKLPRTARERISLVRADMRRFAFGRQFPLVICPFNAFQHLYTREDVFTCLEAVKAHVAPRGLFAFDILNPDLPWLARDPDRRWARTRFRHPRTGQRLEYSTNHDYEVATQLAHIRIYYEPLEPAVPDVIGSLAREHMVQLTHRQFFPVELDTLMWTAGFRVRRHDGGFRGEPLTAASESQIVVADVFPVGGSTEK